MPEPPSDPLWQRLREGLDFTPADLRRARGRVKQLARDLPAFDTVWIDAFNQTGRLTPYQARLLENDPTAPLRLGEFVLLDELGHGNATRIWLVRRNKQRTQLVLKRLSLPAELRPQGLERARKLIGCAADLRHPSVNLPTECFEHDGDIMLVAPYVPGLPLHELLVRRGRFPAQVVNAITRQLVDGLTAAHAAGIVHGDLRRSHVRITDRGTAVLVETAVQPLVRRDITIHAVLALDAYDGIAPELIGIGRTLTPASDWYALGCLLWQLLAGRPPFPMADPLAKLAAHQTRTIEDVRERAPDTPDRLAELIAGLTQSDPSRRLAAVQTFRGESGRPTRRDRQRIAQFRREFDTAVPHLRAVRPRDAMRWPIAITAACLGVLVIAMCADLRTRSHLLSLASSWSQTGESRDETPVSFSADLLPLPAPLADGTMILDHPGPYAAATVRFPGTLTLKAAEGVFPEIVIRDQPLKIAAEHWKCERVRLRADRMFRAVDPAKILVDVVAERVTWDDCVLDLGEQRKRSGNAAEWIGVRWRPVEGNPLQAKPILRLTNCQLQGAGAMWHVAEPRARIMLQNVLHQGRGSLIGLSGSHPQDPCQLDLANVTLRDSGPLVRCEIPPQSAAPRLTVTATDCVFQPRRGQPLLDYASASLPVWTSASLVWSGEGSVLTADIPLLAWTNPETGVQQELEPDAIELDGLAIGQVRFAGLPTPRPADSVVVESDTPRRSTQPPGILAERFLVTVEASADL